MKRKNRMRIVIILGSLNLAFGPAVVGKVREGNKLYEKENYDEALRKYTDAQIDRPESPEIFFNIANILYKQRKYSDAEQMLEKAIPQSETQLEANIHYNIGNCKYKQGQLRESIDYYKKALEINPNDEDAKYNIEFVEKKIKEMMSQAKERMEKQKKEEGKKQQGAGEKEKTQEETQPMGEKGISETQALEEKVKEETAPQEQAQPKKPEEMSKEETESLLRMMADEEKSGGKLEDKRKRSSYYPEVEKPW